ncbi:metal-dependent transcriptional regulator [Cellulomonas sp. P22]|uniref:metal-dependent transcriptional regulator n=1 Tax=Cellulomonas sp. P22 TaxID=3373189 RepID=UPI0037B7EF50
MSPAEPIPLTSVAQDYLKVIWSAREWSSAPVTTKMLAERLGVGASTVSETVRRLTDQGLVTHAPYASIELTEAGARHAVAMVRRHRLIETFLVSELGYGWDEVHDEAEVLEHAVSDLMIDRIDARLGHPTRDPHGDPIPTPDGLVPSPPAQVLWDLSEGEWVVARISDADPELLRYLASVGLVLDARVEVAERRHVAGVAAVQVRPPGSDAAAGRGVELGQSAASAIWLVPAG